MKKQIRRALFLLIVAGIVAGGFYWFRSRSEEDPTDVLTLYGNVDIREIRLAFEVQGRVAEIPVEEGDTVEAGNTVARLEERRYRLAVDRAEAAVEGRRQQVARLRAGTREEEIAVARAEVREAEARLAEAKQTFERIRELAETDYASAQQVDDTRAAVETARARLDARKQSLALAVKGPRREDIAAAEAELAQAKTQLALAREDLDDTALKAPADAIERDRILEPGDMASPGVPALILARTDLIWVRTYLPEPDLGRIAPGQSCTVHTDSFPDKKYDAWIGYVSPTAEFTPKHVQTPELRTRLVFQVRVHVRNPENELRLGMPVTVTIPLGDAESQTESPSA